MSSVLVLDLFKYFVLSSSARNKKFKVPASGERFFLRKFLPNKEKN